MRMEKLRMKLEAKRLLERGKDRDIVTVRDKYGQLGNNKADWAGWSFRDSSRVNNCVFNTLLL